ncbi:MAG: hypothetical protein H0U61_02650 [Nocardioidaceae bacterium]|nr:hypothetical protein [Nocardioidaceae bacterium]
MAWIVNLDQQARRWTGRRPSGDGIRLHEGRDLQRPVEELARSLGGRCGIDAVLGDLDREAAVVDVPATTADYGFRWDDEDFSDGEWWPQGITTSADAADTDDIRGRRVIVVGWYAKRRRGRTQGVRLSFVDITDESAPRYRHVLLVEPRRHWATRKVTMRPVPVHAGGIVWYGPSILVADTRGGMRTFDLDDICRVDGSAGRRGYRYVLPQRTSYRAVNDRGFLPFKFSFVSLDRSGEEHQLIAGEYGKKGIDNRLIRFGFDAERAALAMQEGTARPLELLLDQLPHMQGATVVGGTYYISTSRGSRTPGSMWVRKAGEAAREVREALSVGPEDLTYWPQRDSLWNCSEYPGHRFVYAIPRSRLDPDQPMRS